MTLDDANIFAKRLKGLLPRMTDQQVIEARNRMEKYDREPTSTAIDLFTMSNDEFSMPKLIAEIDRQVNPMNMPNSYESRKQAREQENELWQRQAVGIDRLRECFGKLDKPERDALFETFKSTDAYSRSKVFHDVQIAKGRASIPFLVWAYSYAHQGAAR